MNVINLGNILKKHSQCYTLYSVDGIAPTLQSGQKRFGGLPIFIADYDNTSAPSMEEPN